MRLVNITILLFYMKSQEYNTAYTELSFISFCQIKRKKKLKSARCASREFTRITSLCVITNLQYIALFLEKNCTYYFQFHPFCIYELIISCLFVFIKRDFVTRSTKHTFSELCHSPVLRVYESRITV